MCALSHSPHFTSHHHITSLLLGHAARESPTAEIRSVIESLCADMKNIVFVVSGKELPQVSGVWVLFGILVFLLSARNVLCII